MTTLREASQQALEALDSDHPDVQLRAAVVLRAALAQQEQEPVAWMLPGSNAIIMAATKVYRGVLAKDYTQPLYTHPPHREWQSLTEDEIRMAYGKDLKYRDGDYERFARAVEAALKEKNHE